jgi:hypothetical protein
MLEQKTVIDQIKKDPNGTILIRFGKLRLENDVVTRQEWHRTSIAPGQDMDYILKAVNVHLAQMGESEIATESSRHSQLTPAFLRELVAATHTPEVILKYQDDIKQANALLKPRPTLMRRIISALTP